MLQEFLIINDYKLGFIKNKNAIIFEDNRGFNKSYVILYSLEEKCVLEEIHCSYLVELLSN